MTDTDVTFLLTSGGHNAGIVSEPGRTDRHFRLYHRPAEEKYVDPDTWFDATPSTEGSWWPVWTKWLESRSGSRVAPRRSEHPPMATRRSARPGHYVLER